MTIEILISEVQHTLLRCPHYPLIPWFDAPPPPHPLRYPGSVPLLPPIHLPSLIPYVTLVRCPWWIVIRTIRVGSILRYDGDVILILIFSIKRIQGRDDPCSVVDLELAVVRTNVLDGITYLQKEITLKCKDALQ